MTKKLISFSIIALFCLSGCGKYSDVKSVIKDMTKAVNRCTEDIGKAKSGKEYAKAMDEYTDKMYALKPKLYGLFDKYPELKNTYPDDLKKAMDDYKASETKWLEVFKSTALQFKGDKDLDAAMQKFGKMNSETIYKKK
ncbi:MAG: hypothetical protein KA369_15480 [Spirochaetes bacterium]|nr:hypothetical protein [Spirochaetota bacterium]